MNLIQHIVLFYFRNCIRLYALFSVKKAAAYAFRLFCSPMSRSSKKTAPIFEKAEQLQFQMDDNLLKGYRWNSGKIKKALILHGFSSSVHKFEHFVQPLIDQGYEVLAFDAPAHGLSSGSSVNVLQYKKMIEMVDAQWGPVQAFIAHSFGGLALSLFAEKSGQVATNKMVLIAPATETSTALNSFCSLLKISEKVKAAMREVIHDAGGQWPEYYSINRASKTIKAQVLWIHDRDDSVTPWSDAQKIQEHRFPNFQFVITQGLGHRRIYKDAGVLKTVIEFLS
jgi:pimeloyl-ACP methyl ester carboxylesterase